jgi:GT2 family glycosyltransferase
MQVSIIIVNYNTRALLYNCLESIYSNVENIDFEVIVSDNGSTDGSLDMVKSRFPGVILIDNHQNLGFGAANNKGLAIARGIYIFYLNSDTVLLNNAPKIFYDYWENYDGKNSLGALGCVLLNINLQPTHSFGDFPSAREELREKFSKPAGTSQTLSPPLPHEVDYIAGAALFLKNDDFAVFDERFFLYFEDSDLQLQLAHAGKKRIVIPGPQIIHLEGASNSKSTKKTFEGSAARIQFAVSKIKYYRKRKDNYFFVLLLKLFIIIKWLNPKILPRTAKFFRQLLTA